MKVLMINVVCGIRSTGRICTDIAARLEAQGHEVKIAYGREEVPEKFQKYAVKIGTDLDVKVHGVKARLFDACGFGSRSTTRKFIQWAEAYNPDLLWLHNIHGYYINVEFLFEWIKSRPNMEVKWTLHDCWAFTGHCTYFTMAKCDKWKTGCDKCPQKKAYPASLLLERSKTNYRRKKTAFTGVDSLSLITPSRWLADLTRESYLKEYPVEVIYNKIDTSVFKPTPSDFKKRYGIEDKIVILGVASVWEKRKGLDDFFRLAEMLDDRYVIVLVGLTERQINELPNKVKGIKRTNNVNELVAIYSSVDVFVNPSQEETFGMTTLEAISCGADAIVYEGTACEEVVHNNQGIVVPVGVKNIYKAITCLQNSGWGGGKTLHMIIGIPRTGSTAELAEIYSMADYFVNPTYEDNYPTVNLEARACGTQVITYNTGGAAETLY